MKKEQNERKDTLKLMEEKEYAEAQKAAIEALCPMNEKMQEISTFLESMHLKKQKEQNLKVLMKNVFKMLVRHYPHNTLEKFEEVSYLLK
jgi:hypothetical protein